MMTLTTAAFGIGGGGVGVRSISNLSRHYTCCSSHGRICISGCSISGCSNGIMKTPRFGRRVNGG